MSRHRSSLGGYLLALFVVCAAAFAKSFMAPWPGSSFGLFLAATAVAAWFGGLGPGMLVLAVSAVLAGTVFGPSGAAPLGDPAGLAIFLFEGTVVAVLVAELDLSRRATATARTKLAAERTQTRDSQAALSDLRSRHEQQSRWLEMILRNATEGITLFDRDGRYLLASDSAVRPTGRPREQLIGRTLDELGLPEELCRRFQGQLARVAASRTPLTDEGIWPSPAGPRHVEYVLSPLEGPSGQVESTLATVRDITERRQRETLLREREELFRVVFEDGPLALCIVSTDGRVVRANSRMRDMLGYSESALAERAFDGLSHPDDRDAERPWRERLDAGTIEHYDLEKRLITKDGRPLWVRQSRSAVRDAKGALLYVLAMLENIDVRKRAEAERVALERQLRETQKLESLGVLAGGIAHDFNNLLVPVLGNAELLMEDLPAGSRLQGYAGEIVSAAERAAQLARQMLAYSGKGRFAVEPVDLSALVSSIQDLLKASAGSACALELDLKAGLSAIEGDPNQLRQVVLNLVQNAAEALPEGSGRISVRTSQRHVTREFLAGTYLTTELTEGDYVCLEVVDTGVGMNEATRARLFDPFFTTKGAGRGLGLPAVLGSVRGHGGAIRVDSRPAGGTTVTVLLPPAVVSADRRVGPTDEVAEVGRVEGVVLLVEDEEAVRVTAQRTLERLGLGVMTAEDGEVALELFERHGEDLACALVDVLIPKVSGDEVCRRMRAGRADLPIVVMSGFHAGALSEQLEGVVDAVIQKPFSPVALQDTVRAAIARGKAALR